MAPEALRVSSNIAATCRRRAYSSGRSRASAERGASAPPNEGSPSPAATGVKTGSTRDASDAASSNKAPCAGFSVSSNKDPWRAAGAVAKGAATAFTGAGRNRRSSSTGTGVTWSAPNRRCNDSSVRPQNGARSTDSHASRSPGCDSARTNCTRSATTGRSASGTRSTARQRMPSCASRRVRLPRWLRARTRMATGCLLPACSASACRTRPTAMSSACSSAGAAPARDQAGWKRTAGSGKAP
ncbi:Uncharacterised protein [Achromobacter sp. 2789STDY5608633]|nr:Uncharacterised protein [Achromobacter sp. 2789STDY5608633]